MAKNIASIPRVHFRVPNTEEGQRWLEQARDYVNRERYGEIAARPRGNRPPKSYDSQRDGCTHFGVYLRERRAVEQARYDMQHAGCVPRYRHTREITDQNNHIRRLAGQLQTAHEDLELAGTQRAALIRGFDERLRRCKRAALAWQVAAAALAFVVGWAI